MIFLPCHVIQTSVENNISPILTAGITPGFLKCEMIYQPRMTVSRILSGKSFPRLFGSFTVS